MCFVQESGHSVLYERISDTADQYALYGLQEKGQTEGPGGALVEIVVNKWEIAKTTEPKKQLERN